MRHTSLFRLHSCGSARHSGGTYSCTKSASLQRSLAGLRTAGLGDLFLRCLEQFLLADLAGGLFCDIFLGYLGRLGDLFGNLFSRLLSLGLRWLRGSEGFGLCFSGGFNWFLNGCLNGLRYCLLNWCLSGFFG
jgi:hypothetical protein